MEKVLRLAQKGRQGVSPNPMVGCLVVRRGKTVGTGWHQRFGGPHAETLALAKAGKEARGATLYVNLEPCRHWGKTEPCTENIISSGIGRVVVAHADPNPRMQGTSLIRLKKHGISVTKGVLKSAALQLNRSFLHGQKKHKPYAILKLAQTLDGKIASAQGYSRWITSVPARTLGHRLRSRVDAVLVGAGTLRSDRPQLTSHGQGPDPIRLILSRSGFIPPAGPWLKGPAPTVLITSRHVTTRHRNRLRQKGLLTLDMKNSDINQIFKFIWKLGINQVLIEGGAEIAHACLAAGLIQEVYLFVAPTFLGGKKSIPSVGGVGWRTPGQGPRLQDVSVRRVGPDLLIHGFLPS